MLNKLNALCEKATPGVPYGKAIENKGIINVGEK